MNAAAGTDRKPTWPGFLRSGDVIGLIAPAGPIRNMDRVERGISLLRTRGFQVLSLGRLETGNGFLAASDRQRAAELHDLWARKEVRALLAIRGGYGCLRLLPHLDLELLTKNPKLLIGFSDITALLNLISQETGLVTVHGPVLSSLARCDRQSLDTLFSLLTGNLPRYRPPGLKILRPGSASGLLRGGNLTTLVHLLGTPWEIRWDGTLLILEDTGEPPYRLDRMLTQLAASGVLDRLSGLILGSFDDGGTDSRTTRDLSRQVWERVLELTEQCSCPVWANFPVGHLAANLAIPLGVRATMDDSTGTLQIDS